MKVGRFWVQKDETNFVFAYKSEGEAKVLWTLLRSGVDGKSGYEVKLCL